MKCDLHLHTNCSDGMFSPEQIVDMAKEKGLECIAITDHDTICGLTRAKTEADKLGIKLIYGVELSSYQETDVHILGYNMDISSPAFNKEMERIASFRIERNKQLEIKLREYGFDIDVASLKSEGSVGRADIARAMVEKGYCATQLEAFEKYIGADKPCYVQTQRLTPVEAVQLILKFGGMPVLAHPKNLHIPFKRFESFVKPLVLAGLGGIEAEYFTHNKTERKFYGKVARENRLIVTGGSDFHDYTHGVSIGSQVFYPSNYTRKILGI